MAVTYGFFDSVNADRRYNAEQMDELFDGIVNQGVFQSLGGGLAVSAGSGLAVNVATGKAIIQKRWVKNDSTLALAISAASATYPRYDAVVIKYDGASRLVSIYVKEGSPAASPAYPSMTRSGTTYEMCLAYVYVAANATSVTVTDKRSDSTVCGWVTVAQSTSGEVDAMLNDMKTGFDGVVYSSPAAMVQGCDQKIMDIVDSRMLFVDDFYPVTALYINAAGQSAGITYVHNVYKTGTSKGRIRFSNGSSYVAHTYALESGELSNGIFPITDQSDSSIIYGYISIDWSMVGDSDVVVKQILDRAKLLNYSPSIAAYIQSDTTEQVDQLVDDVYGGYGFIDLSDTYQSASSTQYIWFIYNSKIPKVVNRIQFKSKTGTVNFYKVTYVEGASSLTYDLIGSVVNTEDGVIKNFDFNDIEITANTFIGINGAFWFKASNDYRTRNYLISSGTIGPKQNQVLAFNAVNKNSINGEIEDIKNELAGGEEVPDLKRNGEVVLYNSMLTSSNSDMVGTQTFDVNGNGLIIDGQKILNKYYSVSDRTIRIICKFASNTVARFGTATKASNVYTSSTPVVVDVSNKTIQVSSLPAVAFSILNSTDEFLVSITKKYQYLAVEVRDMYTGDSQEYVFVTNGTGGVGDGAIGTATLAGMQYDYYQFDLVSGGSYTVKQIVIVSATCDLLIYGDSISEPEAYWPHDDFSKSWTQMVAEKMNGRALSSGRSGTTIAQINDRIANELPFIKPKYCMITIGTNGGDTQENLTALVEYIQSQDVIPILNHIPCYNNNGDTTGFRAINTMIDAVRSAKSIKGCDFDIATSVDHDGQTVDTTKMWLETYGSGASKETYYHHPNIKGCACMFERLLIDVPEIFE